MPGTLALSRCSARRTAACQADRRQDRDAAGDAGAASGARAIGQIPHDTNQHVAQTADRVRRSHGHMTTRHGQGIPDVLAPFADRLPAALIDTPREQWHGLIGLDE